MIFRTNRHCSRSSILLLTLAASLFTLCPTAQAAVFCVSSGNQLQNALEIADGNDQDDVIRIVRGTHTSDINGPQDYHWRFWYANIDADDSLTISGGWSTGNNCATQVTLDPSQTILDGENLGPVFNIQPFGTGITMSGDITMSNLTFARGRGQAFNGGGYPVALRVWVPDATSSTALTFDNLLMVSSQSAAEGVSIAEFLISGAGALRVRNSIFHGNTLTHNNTAGIYVRATGNAVGYINNNSVFGNTTQSPRSGFIGGGTLTFSNNAVADNQSSSVALNQTRQMFAETASTISLYNNHFQTLGTSNGSFAVNASTTSGDPQWTQSGSRMVPNTVSQLRNSGRNAPSGGLPEIDFSGDNRVVNDTVDRGAVEGAFIAEIGPVVTAASPANGSTSVLLGAVGEVVRQILQFNVAGGTGNGETEIHCYNDGNAAIVEAPTTQMVGTGGGAVDVSVRMTIASQVQTDIIRCNFSAENLQMTQATYFLEARVGSYPLFKSGFE